MPKASTHSGWSAWWPFVMLCLLGATRGLLTGAFPASSTTLLSASTGCAAAAIALLITSRISHLVSDRTISTSPRTLLAGALLLSGPWMALLLTGHGIDPNALTLALALVPIVTVVAQNALGDTAPGSFAARTWPALAAITGLLLIVPQPSFSNPLTDAILILAPLATGIGAALFSTSTANQGPHDPLPTLTSALSAAALLFGVAWAIHILLHHTTLHLSPLGTLLDAAIALLTLLALRRIGLSRWSAQFAIVPLAVILQGFVLLRPAFDTYNTSGTCLLLLGSIFLLLPQPEEKAL